MNSQENSPRNKKKQIAKPLFSAKLKEFKTKSTLKEKKVTKMFGVLGLDKLVDDSEESKA